MAGILGRLHQMAMLGRGAEFLCSARTCGSRVLIHSSAQRHIVAVAAAKPKSKAPSAYNLFQKDPKAKEGLQNVSLADLSQQLSARWKSLSNSEKQRYTEQAKILKDEVDKLHAPKKRGSSKPRSTNAYALFVKERFGETKSKLPTGVATTDVMKEIAKTWKGLPEGQKSKYKPSS